MISSIGSHFDTAIQHRFWSIWAGTACRKSLAVLRRRQRTSRGRHQALATAPDAAGCGDSAASPRSQVDAVCWLRPDGWRRRGAQPTAGVSTAGQLEAQLPRLQRCSVRVWLAARRRSSLRDNATRGSCNPLIVLHLHPCLSAYSNVLIKNSRGTPFSGCEYT